LNTRAAAATGRPNAKGEAHRARRRLFLGCGVVHYAQIGNMGCVKNNKGVLGWCGGQSMKIFPD